MADTKYERYYSTLDFNKIIRIIPKDGIEIAKGVSAPYGGAQTPCVSETFTFDEKSPLQYFFTDALTGCAGFIAVSGDINSDNQFFKPSKALIIHDQGGDKLESSQKLLRTTQNLPTQLIN